MENFRAKIKRGLGFAISLMLLLPSSLLLMHSKFHEYAVEGMNTSFLMGMLTAFEVILLYVVITYVRALRNEDKLKELYIKSNDERKEFIKKKMAMNTIIAFIVFMYIAIFIAGYKNAVVFKTLVYTLIVFTAILGINKAMLLKKY